MLKIRMIEINGLDALPPASQEAVRLLNESALTFSEDAYKYRRTLGLIAMGGVSYRASGNESEVMLSDGVATNRLTGHSKPTLNLVVSAMKRREYEAGGLYFTAKADLLTGRALIRSQFNNDLFANKEVRGKAAMNVINGSLLPNIERVIDDIYLGVYRMLYP